METIEGLNSKYIENLKTLNTLNLYRDRVLSAQSVTKEPAKSVIASVNLLEDCSKEVGSQFAYLEDTRKLGESFASYFSATQQYKKGLLGSSILAAKNAASNVAGEQKKYDEVKTVFEKKYDYKVSSVNTLNSIIASGISNAEKIAQTANENLKAQARKILGGNVTVELRLSDSIKTDDVLPERMLVSRYQTGAETMPLLQNIGIRNTYKNMYANLKNQGNVLVSTSYEQMNDEAVDDFVLAYALRFIEAFPLGVANVHIFNQNPSYLYKRLSNSFQTDNAGEATKKIVQLHTNMNDLIAIRDINCEDIFKKTSVDKPDLFSIYESDKTDAFNLIILRNGVVDGNGYASTDILETIKSLSKPGDMGHKCGLRFLVIDSSSSFDKQLSSSARLLVSQIQQNFEHIILYKDKNFVSDNRKVEVLRIADAKDVYVQERASTLANAVNGKEQNLVSIHEIASNQTDKEPGSILSVPVGKSGSSIVELPFSCKDDNGTVAGQCVGYMAIGQSGSGKSSFFHSLVLNGCLKYSPEDLQFWLLDFKNGGASSKYSNSGIPHIRMIAENNKIDDALCLFQMVLEEMERRSKAFNNVFADNIVDYNRIAAEKNLEHMPRVIVAIDEVQEIFREDSAQEIQKQISAIAGRMRFAGMHFVMVAQNLSDGKSYMLKDAFLPSATGRICFRVAQDIPRDSGFGDDFIQRKQEITELKTGEAYVSYGKDTIKKVKMAYTSPSEMSDTYFKKILNKYPDYSDRKPLVIGSKKRLSVNSRLQGQQNTYASLFRDATNTGRISAVVGEDVYRMTPLEVRFSQNQNSSILLLGSDKQIASSICTSITVSLIKQNVQLHLFNGDRTKLQLGTETVDHPFLHICRSIGKQPLGNAKNYRLDEFSEVIKNLYTEFSKRQKLVQQADYDDPVFTPIFMVVNDLFGIESFISNTMLEGGEAKPSTTANNGFNYDLFAPSTSDSSGNDGYFRENIQTVVGNLLKNGWRYNMHLVLAVKGDISAWRGARVVSDVNTVLMFNTTQAAEQFDKSYYLKEMLRNIANEGSEETMAVWMNSKMFSKVRPIVYKMSDSGEKDVLNTFLQGENE